MGGIGDIEIKLFYSFNGSKISKFPSVSVVVVVVVVEFLEFGEDGCIELGGMFILGFGQGGFERGRGMAFLLVKGGIIIALLTHLILLLYLLFSPSQILLTYFR